MQEGASYGHPLFFSPGNLQVLRIFFHSGLYASIPRKHWDCQNA